MSFELGDFFLELFDLGVGIEDLVFQLAAGLFRFGEQFVTVLAVVPINDRDSVGKGFESKNRYDLLLDLPSIAIDLDPVDLELVVLLTGIRQAVLVLLVVPAELVFFVPDRSVQILGGLLARLVEFGCQSVDRSAIGG